MVSILSMIVKQIDMNCEAVKYTLNQYSAFCQAENQIHDDESIHSKGIRDQNILQSLELKLTMLAKALSPQCFVLSLLYIDRFTSKRSDFYLCSARVTR